MKTRKSWVPPVEAYCSDCHRLVEVRVGADNVLTLVRHWRYKEVSFIMIGCEGSATDLGPQQDDPDVSFSHGKMPIDWGS